MKKRLQFTNKKQSRQGMASTALGLLGLLMTVAAVAAAYLQKGQAGRYVAVLGFLALLVAAGGFCFGIRGLKEEDAYRLFPFLGCGVNLLLVAGYVMIYMLGW